MTWFAVHDCGIKVAKTWRAKLDAKKQRASLIIKAEYNAPWSDQNISAANDAFWIATAQHTAALKALEKAVKELET